jgi:hypothetical protein
MVLSPPALPLAPWVTGTIYLSSAGMIGLIVYLLEHLYRHPQLGAGFSTYLLELLAIYALMMAGLFGWVFYGDATAFAVAVVLEMVVFFGAVVAPDELALKRGFRPRLGRGRFARTGRSASWRSFSSRNSSWGRSWTRRRRPAPSPPRSYSDRSAGRP